MADASIRSSLLIQKGNLKYQSQPTAFTASLSAAKGPTPGLISATTAGTDVDLSKLSTPGLCRIANIDPTNYVTVGIWEPTGSKFYPILELLPGESFVMRLSRYTQWETGVGTGTDADFANRIRIRGNAAACNVLVEAFEA